MDVAERVYTWRYSGNPFVMHYGCLAIGQQKNSYNNNNTKKYIGKKKINPVSSIM